MNKVFQGAGSIDARLQSASILAKKREDQLKGNRSRFRDDSIGVPENVRAATDAKLGNYLYSYRWEWGRDNTITILNGLSGK